jgi:hypothetical protein
MTIIFTGVTLKKAERDLKRGLLHFSANLTAPVLKAMKWDQPTPSDTSVGKLGQISMASIELSAKQADLFKKGKFNANVQHLSKFAITRQELKGKRGKGKRHLVTFEARFIEGGILALADEWMRAVGDGVADLRVEGELVEETEREEAGE